MSGESLAGRSVIVTGAGRGIGASVARMLARVGALVVVNDMGVALDGTGREEAPATAVVDHIRSEGGEAVVGFQDVADHEQAEALIRQAIDTFGRLDAVINVAGILRDRMIFNMPEADWDSVIRVHLKGTFNTTKHASGYWRALGDSRAHHRIINFTSASGLHGSPGQPNYAAAKMGIVGLTYSCARALRRYGVTANCVSPSAVTRMTESIPQDHSNYTGHSMELSPDHVAPVVAYLTSVRSDWCTGQVLSAEGIRVSLYDVPRVLRTVEAPMAQGLGAVFDEIEEAFRPLVESPPVRPVGPDAHPDG